MGYIPVYTLSNKNLTVYTRSSELPFPGWFPAFLSNVANRAAEKAGEIIPGRTPILAEQDGPFIRLRNGRNVIHAIPNRLASPGGTHERVAAKNLLAYFTYVSEENHKAKIRKLSEFIDRFANKFQYGQVEAALMAETKTFWTNKVLDTFKRYDADLSGGVITLTYTPVHTDYPRREGEPDHLRIGYKVFLQQLRNKIDATTDLGVAITLTELGGVA